MRERSILWDVSVVGLLLVLAVVNIVTVVRGERMENRVIEELQRISSGGGGGTRNYAGSDTQPIETADTRLHSPSYSDGSSNPKFTRGDEDASDGDTLVVNEVSEPN